MRDRSDSAVLPPASVRPPPPQAAAGEFEATTAEAAGEFEATAASPRSEEAGATEVAIIQLGECLGIPMLYDSHYS